MKILLLGSSGFIGKRLLTALKNANYQVICPNRQTIDFLNPDWDKFRALLPDIDIIINTVGIMSRDKNLMQMVHCDTPIQLAKIAKDYANHFHKNIQWINLSALGADEKSNISFVKSKGQGDKGILALADSYFKVNIIRPSLIYGNGGASTELFLKLAKLPILPLPKGGNFNIQPVHADDVVLGMIKLMNNNNAPTIINATGNQVLTLKNYLTILRKTHYHKSPALILPIPMIIAKIGILLLTPFSAMITTDSLTLLEQGNVADNTEFQKLIGKAPILADEFKN